MRTKTLLVTAALSLAGMLAAQAQSNVYSVNVVGYVTKRIYPGFNLIANPLVQTNTTLAALIPNPPQYTVSYIFNDAGQLLINTFDPDLGGWDPGPLTTLDLGKGTFLNVPQSAAAFDITFVGEVFQGSYSNNIQGGYSYRSSPVPQQTNYNVIGFKPVQYDTASRYVNDGVSATLFIYTYDPDLGGWDPGDNNGPVVDVGEAVVYFSGNPGAKLVRSFTVQ